MSEIKQFDLSNYLKEHRIPSKKEYEATAQFLFVQQHDLLKRIRELNAAINNVLKSLDPNAYYPTSSVRLETAHTLSVGDSASSVNISLYYKFACESEKFSSEMATFMNADDFRADGNVNMECDANGSRYYIPITYHDGKYDTHLFEEWYKFNIEFQRSAISTEY